MMSPYLFLIFVILSNMSSKSWFSAFHDYMLKCPSVVQCAVTVFLGLDFVVVCSFFKQWIVAEYIDDHHTPVEDLSFDALPSYEQFKSQKSHDSNR